MKNKQKSKQVNKDSPEYDSAWKDVIEELLEFFLKFFFPEIHKDIDFARGCEFLSKELRKIVPDTKIGKRRADEVIKVWLKNGSKACICIYIHIEVQGTKETDFIVRVYVYNYRIFDYYKDQKIEVVSLAVLTDDDPNYRPDEYLVKRWGYELKMKIPLVKIIDYKIKDDKRKELETSSNPMAMVVKAQLKSSEVKKSDNNKKYSAKWELIRECYKRGHNKKEIITLLKFIDWIIRIPKDYQKKLTHEIEKLEEEYKMPYVTSWERDAEERGMKKGIEENAKETARKMLEDGLPIETISKYTGLTEKEIKALMN